MTTIVIPQFAPVVLQGRQAVRNGLYPTASFTHDLINLANHVARFRTKEVGRFALALANVQSVVGDIGYGFFHSSPYASRLWAVMTAAGTGSTTTTPSVRVQCLTTAPANVGTASFFFGQGPAAVTPASFASSGPLPLLDASGVPAVIPPDTDLRLLYSDFNGGSMVNAVVYEEALPSDSATYVDPAVAVMSPIYDATTQGLATMLRLLYRRGSSHLFTFNAIGTPSTRFRTTISATDVNLVDPFGAPTPASPGFTLDLSFHAQARDAALGIHVIMAVFGRCTVAGNGAVKLKSQAAGTVLTAGPFGTLSAWVTVAGYLPEFDKHNLEFSTAAGTLTIQCVSVFLQGS